MVFVGDVAKNMSRSTAADDEDDEDVDEEDDIVGLLFKLALAIACADEVDDRLDLLSGPCLLVFSDVTVLLLLAVTVAGLATSGVVTLFSLAATAVWVLSSLGVIGLVSCSSWPASPSSAASKGVAGRIISSGPLISSAPRIPSISPVVSFFSFFTLLFLLFSTSLKCKTGTDTTRLGFCPTCRFLWGRASPAFFACFFDSCFCDNAKESWVCTWNWLPTRICIINWPWPGNWLLEFCANVCVYVPMEGVLFSEGVELFILVLTGVCVCSGVCVWACIFVWTEMLG